MISVRLDEYGGDVVGGIKCRLVKTNEVRSF